MPGPFNDPYSGSPLQRQPLFGDNAGVRFTGPVNINMADSGSTGAIMQIALPMIMQSVMSKSGMTPGQFFPTQNIYDQMLAKQQFMGQQQAMQIASRRDMAFTEDFLGGATRLMTGRDPTEQERQRNFYMARQISNMMPLATNILGPDLVDQLHGQRGSATVFAQRMHQAMRTGLDPVTGQIGMSGQSSAVLTNEIYEQLYGRGANLMAMKNLRAGQAGLLAEELQMRGFLGPSFGARPLADRIAGMPGRLDEGTIQRLAEQNPQIRDRLARGEPIPETMMEHARINIRQTHQRLAEMSAGGQQVTASDLEAMPGGEDILRLGDAQRISSRLKGMAGVVSAMRDIFGDMGHPNAPMREIVNGLEALTQGSVASMSPAELERMVRMTHVLGRQTGIGMQGMLGLTAQGAELADRLGLDRSFAVTATQGAASFGAAVGDTQGLDIPAWGSLTKEQLTLLDQQLRLTAAASPVTNQINAALRMADEGVIAAPAGSELEAMLNAARGGKGTYEFGGETKSVQMNRADFIQMMERDAGVGANTTMRFLFDKYGNQEYGMRYGTADVTRELQRKEALRVAQQSFADATFSEGASADDIAKLQELGVIEDEADLRSLSREVGGAMGRDLFNLSEEDLRNTTRRTDKMSGSFDAALRAAVARRLGPDATAAEIDAATAEASSRLGGGTALAASGWAALDTNVRTNPRLAAYKSGLGLMQAHNEKTHQAALERRREAQADVAMQSALSGMASDPLERTMDAIANARPETTANELLSEVLGGIKIDKLAENDPVVRRMRDAMAAVAKAERTDGKLTEAGLASVEEQSRLIKALREGGAAARTELERREKAGTLDPETRLALESASQEGADLRLMREGAILGTKVGREQISAVAGAGRTMTRLLAEKSPEAGDAIATFITGSRERASALLDDEKSMEQLGAGGMDVLEGISAGDNELRLIAEQESKRLGKQVTIADVLQGTNGVSGAATKKAKAAAARMQQGWDEVRRRRELGVMPKEGTSAAMTDREKKMRQAMAEFNKLSGQDQAALAADSLAAVSDEKGYLDDEFNKKQLMEKLAKGDKADDFMRATAAHDQLLRMTVEKGFLGKELKDATTAEKKAALDKLYAAADAGTLDEATTRDVKRAREDRALLGDVGLVDRSKEDEFQAVLKQIEAFQGASRDVPLQTKPEETQKVELTGTLKLIEDDKGQLAATGTGTPSHTPLVAGGVRGTT